LANYETFLANNNDIPNKLYVDTVTKPFNRVTGKSSFTGQGIAGTPFLSATT
jgi:hypothetical protein